MTGLSPRVREAADRVARAEGVEVLEIRLVGGGRGRTLDVVVDADGPVGAEVTARLAKRLSAELDELDPIRGAYTLQVGTPGLDRPLRTARDFRRQLGHEVTVTRTEADRSGDQQPADPQSGPPREVRGVVRAADPDTLTLEVGGQQVRLPFAEIDQGRVVLPW